jgi:hypothetical protein
MRSGWAWFFAGTTIALGLVLAALVWSLVASGLYGQLAARVLPAAIGPAGFAATAAPRADAGGPAAAPAAPTAIPTAGVTPPAGATPWAGGAPPGASTPPPPAAGAIAAQRAQILSSSHWKLLIGEVKSEPQPDGARKVVVDVTLKNDSSRADVLAIPATLPAQPRSRPASWEPVQMAEPPSLQLRVYDRANRPFGGGFVAANGEGGGSFTFVAAPGDAIRLPFAFEIPSSSADPLTLEAQFGQAAGGAGFRVALDASAQPPAKLEPSDLVKVHGTEQRYLIEGLWSLTLLDVSVGQPNGSGERTVTARLSAENLTGRPLAVGATENDPLGASGDRDFYVVDSAGRVAYSSGDSMPRQPIPAGATRTVDVRMKGYRDFATSGPFRFSVVVDPRRDQYAIFRTGG